MSFTESTGEVERLDNGLIVIEYSITSLAGPTEEDKRLSKRDELIIRIQALEFQAQRNKEDSHAKIAQLENQLLNYEYRL